MKEKKTIRRPAAHGRDQINVFIKLKWTATAIVKNFYSQGIKYKLKMHH